VKKLGILMSSKQGAASQQPVLLLCLSNGGSSAATQYVYHNERKVSLDWFEIILVPGCFQTHQV